nr:MAG TPA: hypothetical protein [Caudoviricetes sp.]
MPFSKQSANIYIFHYPSYHIIADICAFCQLQKPLQIISDRFCIVR